MTQEEQQRSEVANYWWEKAESSILSAQRELDAGAIFIQLIAFIMLFFMQSVLFF